MIIGTGMIAKAFANYKDDSNIIIFASGVSNSQEIRETEYQREKELLLANIEKFHDKLFIYFSTCSIYDPSMADSKYVQHKMQMEAMLQQRHINYYIFRLPQVVGKTKSPTLVNTLAKKIQNQELFDVWRFSTRNLIDSDDVFRIGSLIITDKLNPCSIINIASSTSCQILTIVYIIEVFFDTKALYKEIDRGCDYKIDISDIKFILKNDDIIFHEEYPEFVLRKYLQNNIF